MTSSDSGVGQIPRRVPSAAGLDGNWDYHDFETRELLGTGGNAAVYEAVLPDGPDRTVALKEPFAREDAVHDRFRAEAETWERLDDHEGIVSVLDWGIDPHPWIALEYMDGGALCDRDPGVAEAVWIATRLAAAVQHAHRHGVAHLDLKPGNVLFRSVPDAWDSPKVSDFGLARRLIEGRTDLEGISPRYAAPEQFDPERFGRPDDATDVYQLGALVYRLLTGEPPYCGRPQAVMDAVLAADPPAPRSGDPSLPAAADAVVERALAREKADRYESVLDLRRDLETLLADLIDYEPRSSDRELTGSTVLDTGSGGRSVSDRGAGNRPEAGTDGRSVGRPGATAADRAATPGADGTASVGGLGTVIELEEQGFVRLSPGYFERREPAPPVQAWRSGLRLADVHHGYAVERRIDRDGEAVPLTEDLVERLAAGADVALVGPPGSGKSTVCKQVACEWYDRARGPVFYRESGRGTSFDSPAVLRRAIAGSDGEASRDAPGSRTQSGDGHALVVVEDAVREPASAVFDLVERFEGRSDVTFLLDARRSEWETARTRGTGGGLPGRRRSVEVTRLPRPDRAAYERFVDAFERAADVTVDVPVEELVADVRREAEDDDGRHGELFLLLHRLTTYADSLTRPDATTTPLTAAVRSVAADCRDLGDLALDVATCANLLNAAGMGVSPEHLHAVDPDADTAVAEAVDCLEDRVLFPREDDRRDAYRTVHGAWSTAFLEHLIEDEGERAVHERVGRALSGVLALADDEDRRETVRWILHGETPALDRLVENPADWAAETVVQVFELVRDRPSLVGLVGESEYSRIDLPDACGTTTELRCQGLRIRTLLEGGRYDWAEREIDRLSARVDAAADREEPPDWTVDYRIEALLGRADLAIARSEHQDAIATVERAETLLSEADGPVEELELPEAKLLLVKGTAQFRSGDLDAAQSSLERAREIAADADEPSLESRSTEMLGKVERSRGNLAEARDHYERTLAIARSVGDLDSVASALTSLGIIASSRGDLDLARRRLKESNGIARERNDTDGLAMNHGNLAVMAHKEGDLAATERHAERALELLGDDRRPDARAKFVGMLGKVAKSRGDLATARERYHEELSIAENNETPDVEAITHYDLGSLALLENDLETARDHLERAIEIAERIDHGRKAMTFRTELALVERRLGEFDAAADRYRTALDERASMTSPDVAAGYRLELAGVERQRGNHETARDLATRASDAAEELSDPTLRARAYRQLGILDRESGAYDRALEHARSGLSAAEDPAVRGILRGELGLTHAERGDRAAAREHLAAGVETLADAGEEAVEALDLVDRLVEVCVEDDDPGAAADWCRTAAGIADRFGRDGRAAEFEDRRSSLLD